MKLYSVVRAVKSSPTTPRLLAYGFGFVVGLPTGVWLTKRYLETQFEHILEKEIEETKNYYRTLYKTDIPTPSDHPGVAKAVEEEYEEIVEEKYKSERNVTDRQPHSDWFRDVAPELQDEDVVMTVVNPSSEIPPYLIEGEEFFENEPAFEQTEVVYYLGDRTLVEAPDNVWVNPAEWLGDDFDDILGVLDRVATEVFVRNNKAAMMYHIELDTGSYSDTFAAENELKHANRRERRRQPKFRGDDG